jgi:hypothetical protein
MSKGRDEFPYELLVQIYNQRIQIISIAIAFSLAFLGAFYTSLTDPYFGDRGLVPILVMVIGLFITIALYLFECRNIEIFKNNEECRRRHLELVYHTDNISEREKEIIRNLKALSCEETDVYSYGSVTNLVFSVLYFVEGMSIQASIIFFGIDDVSKLSLGEVFKYLVVSSVVGMIILVVFWVVIGILSLCKPFKTSPFPRNPLESISDCYSYRSKPNYSCPKISAFIFIPFFVGCFFTTTILLMGGVYIHPKDSSQIQVELVETQNFSGEKVIETSEGKIRVIFEKVTN